MNRCLALVVLVSLSAIGAVLPARAATSCLVTPEVARVGEALPAGLWAIAPARDGSGPRVEISCSGGRVVGITMRLGAGQVARARLLLTGRVVHRAAFFSGDDMPSAWGRVEFWNPDSGSTAVTLNVEAPDSAESGKTYSGRVRLGDDRSGISIPVSVRLIEEDPLFRDTFDVDPVIGQFSQVW